MKVLVTGGSGYIGAHIVRLLHERGDEPVLADDLVSGLPGRVAGIPTLQTDLSEDGAVAALTGMLREHRVEAVIHMAGRKQVPESVRRAAWYYRQNVGGLANVLQSMQDAGVGRLIFSSSAAVYATSPVPVVEAGDTGPVNPYGETKLVGEQLISSATRSFGLTATSLRYFNVAGAGSPDLGDVHALNLVPMVFERIERGERPAIFGDDFDTPDGTCVRDYVHVSDLADAHVAALRALDEPGPPHRIYNVGTGTGYSVRQMVDSMIALSGSPLSPVVEGRRPGDPASVVADVSLIRRELGWTARHGIDEILSSAWEARRAAPPAAR